MSMVAGVTDTLRVRLGEALGGDYTIERELPAGGMGRVFVAAQRSLHRSVVVKVVADAGRGLDVLRFRQEILLSAGLQHPHIVPVHAAGDVDGAPYFVMPFVDGTSLRAMLESGRALPLNETMRILRDIASALRYAHSRGIVHRDLKPENVMLSAGSVVVLDFGVAKAMASGAATAHAAPDRPASGSITGMGFTVGTPGYMAPEQVAGDPSLDHRADLYSFGVLAFELCTGRPVFEGSPSEILRQHLASPPPDLASMRAELPARLVALVHACLQKDPAARPADASVMLDMLDGASIKSGSASAHDPGRRVDVALSAGRKSRLSEAFVVPAAYVLAAGPVVAYLLHLAQTDRVREGIAAAGVMGALLGLPLAIAGGMILRVMDRERAAAG